MIVNALDIDEVKARLADGSILIVDVREPHEFMAGHIPGSVSLPLSQFDPADLPSVPGKTLVLSCGSGVRSLHAMAYAQSAGLDVDTHYAGGFRDWVAHGEAVAR
ncbi:rhodanese-like domain-containing protein [Bosea sp. TWI1241]|uniref:rhodanese-like domain-containing protein n=1 Tax=Bosea sp. TWI1241 TaxID=3148904 RepID=UPI00320A73B7